MLHSLRHRVYTKSDHFTLNFSEQESKLLKLNLCDVLDWQNNTADYGVDYDNVFTPMQLITRQFCFEILFFRVLFLFIILA